MIKKYKTYDKKFKSSPVVTLEDINLYAKTYLKLKIDFTEADVIEIAKKVAKGRIITETDYQLFYKILSDNVECKKYIKTLMKKIIFCSKNYDKVIGKNAYIQYNLNSVYKEFILQAKLSQKEIKEFSNHINPGSNEGNITCYLEKEYNEFVNNIVNKEKNYTLKTLDMWDNYYKVYYNKKNELLDLLVNLKITGISRSSNVSNQIYYLIDNYLTMISNDIDNLNFKSYELFCDKYRILKEYDLQSLNINQLYYYGLNKYYLFLKNDFSTEVVINKLCNVLKMKKNVFLTLLKNNNIDLYNDIKNSISDNKNSSINNDEIKFDKFINDMKKVIIEIDLKNFTPLMYYSLTRINIIEMIKRVNRLEDKTIFSYLSSSYYFNQNLYTKVDLKTYLPYLEQSQLQQVAIYLKENNLPKIKGVVDEVVNKLINNSLGLNYEKKRK